MNLKKIALTATMAGALGLGSLAGGSAATADDDFNLPGVPGVPGAPGDIDIDVPDIDLPEGPELPDFDDFDDVDLPEDLVISPEFQLPLGPGPGVLAPPGWIGKFIGVPPGQWSKVFPVQLVPVLPLCPDLNPGCVNQI